MMFMVSAAAPCAQHTDNMVELRYCLWRVPMALHAMVTAVEEEKVNKVEQKDIKGCGSALTYVKLFASGETCNSPMAGKVNMICETTEDTRV